MATFWKVTLPSEGHTVGKFGRSFSSILSSSAASPRSRTSSTSASSLGNAVPWYSKSLSTAFMRTSTSLTCRTPQFNSFNICVMYTRARPDRAAENAADESMTPAASTSDDDGENDDEDAFAVKTGVPTDGSPPPLRTIVNTHAVVSVSSPPMTSSRIDSQRLAAFVKK